jgi:hypothetical protein
MTERSLRFAVLADDGRTSDIWKCWTVAGTGKSDVYLTSRPLGNALKLSLHHGGRWHVGFHPTKKDELFEPDTAPATRFLGEWARPNIGAEPFILAARILFPWSNPTDAHAVAPKGTVWIPCAPKGKMVEVALFLLSMATPPDDWPAKTSMGTALVGSLPLEGGGQVSLVYRNVPMWTDAQPLQGTPNYFRGQTKSDLAGANRMVAWGEAADGSLMFVESRLSVDDGSAALYLPKEGP